jgi:hypothetical protein
MENSTFKIFKKIFFMSFLMISFVYPFTCCKKNSTTPYTPPDYLKHKPQLRSPKDGETLDNGRTDGKDLIQWDFEWSGPEYTEYTLEVWRVGSMSQPIIKTKIRATSYHYESQGYIPNKERFHWKWSVRYYWFSMCSGGWLSSGVRNFRVEPVNTDPPSN